MNVDEAVAQAFRHEWGRVVATLISTTGNWDVAEECAQEAFAQALVSWPRDGVPRAPGAWLTTVARNRALDRMRRGANEQRKLEHVATMTPDELVTTDVLDSTYPDDRLQLIFTCCHPALPLEGRVALTLRTLTGLSVAEIARAFLVSEQTMAKRLVRARQKIERARIPYRVPPVELLPTRTAGVLAVLYLLFNEGYSASSGADLTRPDLCQHAIELGRALHELLPDNPEVTSLLALMLFQHSRTHARTESSGDLIRLDEQDRSLWDHVMIDEGSHFLAQVPGGQRPGYYQLQACIASCHATATTAELTDWSRIAYLYGELASLTTSPVIELNRAVAVGMSEGPDNGLLLVEALDNSGALGDYYLLHATRADLLLRLGRVRDAAEYFARALVGAGSEPERRYLANKLRLVRESVSASE